MSTSLLGSVYTLQSCVIRSTSVVSPEMCHFVSNHQKWTSSLVWAILVVTLSTSFVMGVNIGGPNVYNSFIIPWARGYPFPCQKDDDVGRWVARVWWGCNYNDVALMNKTGYYYLPEVPSNKLIIQSLIDSVHTICFVIGGAVGGLTGQYWYMILTRRNAVTTSMIFQLMASVLMIMTLEIYYGYDKGDPSRAKIIQVLQFKDVAIASLYLSRFLSGCSAGTGCVVTTIYLMDISPRTIRGEIITFHQLFIVIGILVGQIVGIPWLLGQHNTWNWGMSWIGLFSLVGCFLIWTLPESPRWLVQDQQKEEAALSLRSLRRSTMIDAELDEIERQEASVGTQNVSIYTLCVSPRFRWPLLTSIVLNVAQQFSGINTVFFYSSQIFSSIGLLEDKVYWGILSTGMVNLIATIVTLKLIELFGRRPLILYPLAIITFVMILLCLFIQINVERLAIVVILLILVFIAMFAIGLGPIPYVYPNEVFAIDARPVAVSVSMFACWVCNTLVTLLFPPLQSIMHGYVFLIFCVCCLLAFGLLWLKMSETRRKKLSEIEAFWMQK